MYQTQQSLLFAELIHFVATLPFSMEVLHNNLQKCTEITLRVHELHPTDVIEQKGSCPKSRSVLLGGWQLMFVLYRQITAPVSPVT